MTSAVAFNGFDLTTQASPRGGRFCLTGFDGWLTVNRRRERQEKMQQGGAHPSTGFTASLPITVQGRAIYPTAEAAALERRELLALAADNVPLTVVDAAGEGTRYVETDSLIVSPVMDRQITYALVATACDPLLYGPSLFAQTTTTAAVAGAGRVWPRVWPRDWGVPPGVTPGSIFCPNDGTASYHPFLRVDGPCTNPVVTVQETGDQVRYYGTLVAGAHLDINWGEVRRVSIGDNPVSVRNDTTIVGNALAIPVGGGSLTFSADASSAAATLSAWHFQGAWS